MELLWYFFIYSFLGFLLEVAFAAATRAEKRDRKCRLLLPICPVYGLGMAVILLLPLGIRERPWLLWLASMAAATGVEYLLAVFYESAWGVKFWDYSALPGNFQGRVCLLFSLIWGALAVVLVTWVHPLVAGLAAQLPDLLLMPLGLVFLLDSVVTGQVLRLTGTTRALMWYRPVSWNR